MIRRFREPDAKAVSELIAVTVRESNSRDYPAGELEELIRRMTPEYILSRAGWTHFYVAEQDGRLIGCGAIGPYWNKEDESSLFTIFVLPEFQRQGIGRALIETLERDEYALRAKRIEIPASVTGVPFYLKMGYTYKNGVSEPDGEHLVRMEKRRTSPAAMQVQDRERKMQIAREILEDLQDWFEVSETREAYIRNSADQMFFMAAADGQTAGFLCIRETGKDTAELAVMGVRRGYHRRGVGRCLVEAARTFARQAGCSFLQVKTVRMGMYPDYDITNRFYLSVGFRELEVFPDLWDAANPCQIYVMSLENNLTLLDLIRKRHSYRGTYKAERVPREDLEAIMEAGLAAPSGCNKQTTSLIAVDDPALLAKLMGVIDPPVCETAPAVICVLSQKIIAYRDRCFSVQDYSAAIENMLLAICALGYQSCWYEGHITDLDRIGAKIAGILGVPEDYELVCILPVGKAEKEPKAPPKKKFEERAWFNGFCSGQDISI